MGVYPGEQFTAAGTEKRSLIIRQMMKTEAMKAENQMLWVQSINSIRNRVEEIIKAEIIYC